MTSASEGPQLHWSLVIGLLYAAILAVLTAPVSFLTFYPEFHVREIAAIYLQWQYWLCLVLMALSQAALIFVPVRFASRRPVSRNSLLLPILSCGLMCGLLIFAAGCVIIEGFEIYKSATQSLLYIALGAATLSWVIWAIIFFRMGRAVPPADLITRQCSYLLRGSILELLIAVPTHIVARSRNECCAGVFTFFGLSAGIAVMLFSFGPAVFFLYLSRWRRLHPEQTEETGRM